MSGVTDAPVNPWDQLPGESDAAYARFLVYRNLGPQRTIDAAYNSQSPVDPKSPKRHQAPGSWRKDSKRFAWPRRAVAWDLDCLIRAGPGIGEAYLKLLCRFATGLLSAIDDGRLIKPSSLEEFLKAVDL